MKAAKCPDGSKSSEKPFRESCEDLICGPKEKCVQINKHFAKCCRFNQAKFATLCHTSSTMLDLVAGEN
ncbi:hypothetical protein L596_015585 [Steinernema carpocapsae]|uniref:Uncharacterized protein n=1 Tax=Steinernema carpocapsae TaxID=34508 RepID=A0A4U5NGB7_STECR|nr:hypothetical protein L596_015585 [Steinernema carpocapsae]